MCIRVFSTGMFILMLSLVLINRGPVNKLWKFYTIAIKMRKLFMSNFGNISKINCFVIKAK